MIFAIDPGPETSGWVVFDRGTVVGKGIDANPNVMSAARQVWGERDPPMLAIEMIASYGMAVGAEVFETCVWIGRFLEAHERACGQCHRVFRLEVKRALCNDSRANDANIRKAILDRFGGGGAAIGKRSAPGPLYGVTGHMWAALAVAVTVEGYRAP